MDTTRTHSAPLDRRQPRLQSVVCGIDASRHDDETVRQAALLADPDGSLELICVIDAGGVGANARASISPARAEAALDSAQRLCGDLGVRASGRLLQARDPWPALAEASAGHDLLVLGAHAGSRTEGILIGSVATEALHRAELPVLIARPNPTPFPRRIMVATDGSPGSAYAVELAAAVCARRDASVTLVTVGAAEDREHRHALAVQAAELFEASRTEPAIVTVDGMPRTALVREAAADGPSLVVLGSSGRSGIHALGSVSEHVAHHVSCSVLVARHPVTTPNRP